MTDFKPLLAAPAGDLDKLTYPVLVSPKLDGVRCIIIGGVAMSRSLKPIPNRWVQQTFGKVALNGLDGELIVGPATAPDVYNTTMSGVMSVEGTPQVRFFVFDDAYHPGDFVDRLASSAKLAAKQAGCVAVAHMTGNDRDDLLRIEAEYLVLGYEGAMIRSLAGSYKYGRSTAKEQILLKLKRFVDAEATILGFTPLMTNHNAATVDKLGHKVRSSHKANKVATEQLGALLVKDLKTGVEFEVGTGFSEADRVNIWHIRKLVVGKLIKYKSQPVGVKDKPRFPVFLGFRDEIDL